MTDRLISRRDFLKLAGLGAAAAAATKFEIAPRIQGEVPASWRVASGLKVSEALSKAEASGEKEQIIEARKLMVVWAFAESSSLFAKDAGLEKSGKTMEHYLYGNGQDLDISPWFKEVMEQKSFWLNLVREAFFRFLGEREGIHGISREKFLNLFAQLRKKLYKGYTFASGVDIEGESGMDWNYAIGHSTYTMRCDAEMALQPDEFSLTLQDMDINLFDIYNWELTFETSIPDKANLFAQQISQPLFKWFLNTEDNVDKMLTKINFPLEKRQKILETMEFWRMGASQKIRGLSSKVKSLEEWAIQSPENQIVEKDIALLKKIGAKDYNIYAAFQYPGKMEIPAKSFIRLD